MKFAQKHNRQSNERRAGATEFATVHHHQVDIMDKWVFEWSAVKLWKDVGPAVAPTTVGDDRRKNHISKRIHGWIHSPPMKAMDKTLQVETRTNFSVG